MHEEGFETNIPAEEDLLSQVGQGTEDLLETGALERERGENTTAFDVSVLERQMRGKMDDEQLNRDVGVDVPCDARLEICPTLLLELVMLASGEKVIGDDARHALSNFLGGGRKRKRWGGEVVVHNGGGKDLLGGDNWGLGGD